MISLKNVRQSALLRQASGYIELAEFNMTPNQEISKPAQKLLITAIQLLDRLSETERSNGNAIVLRAEALRALGQFSDALPYFQRAVANTPQSMTSWLGFGWCLKSLGKLQEAITVLTQGIDICGDDPILAYNLSCYHSLAGNVPAAIESLTKAITSDDRFRSLTSGESDFDPIRDDPRFVAVIGQPV
jgi:tetratricopeptide (TPR) repeat protein